MADRQKEKVDHGVQETTSFPLLVVDVVVCVCVCAKSWDGSSEERSVQLRRWFCFACLPCLALLVCCSLLKCVIYG